MITVENALQLMRESLCKDIDNTIAGQVAFGYSKFIVASATKWDANVLEDVLTKYKIAGWNVRTTAYHEIWFSVSK